MTNPFRQPTENEEDFDEQVRLDRDAFLGEADREYQSRLEAERCTLQLKQRSNQKLDSGKRPIEDSPLFGGPSQSEFFSEEAA